MKLIVLVGPPGCGKTTRAKQLESEGFIRVNQDDRGKFEHLQIFEKALASGKNIVVDRMNFNRQQRSAYLTPAKRLGYKTEIIVLHESYNTCFTRMMERKEHPTIKSTDDMQKALSFFFKNYERVESLEADIVECSWPDGQKPKAIICDLDGTLCNIDHRLKWVRVEAKKNWPMFFAGIKDDQVNIWCAELLTSFWPRNKIVYCSGRGDEYRLPTEAWLEKHGFSKTFEFMSDTKRLAYSDLFMRQTGDHRPDHIVKEIILEFEILTRYEPYFFIDDRQQVVDMWRKHSYTCLQCAKGDF